MSEPLLDPRGTSRSIIGGFYAVYNALGFGFLEHIYAKALERELTARGHRVAREVSIRVFFKGEVLAEQRMDMIVDEEVLVEIKSTYELRKEATRQVYNYLRSTNLDLGLLLHFGPQPKPYRIVHPHSKKALTQRSPSI
jgi:GxxExxY protein